MYRRGFLKTTGLAGIGVCAYSQSAVAQSKVLANVAKKNTHIENPIRTIQNSEVQSLDFNGDDIHRTHEILWNIDGYLQNKGGIPKPTLFSQYVIAGGGMSGLLSAYLLKSESVYLLEQADRFGGNSKGEKIANAEYSIGAAYVTVPVENSELDLFYKNIGVSKLFRHESDVDTRVKFKNELVIDFWKGVTDPNRATDFIKVAEELRRVNNEAYPDIPWTTDSDITYEELCRLDSLSFQDWLFNKFGDVHPHILEYFQKYCWSSFGGSIDELSAAQVLNFVASEVDGVLALPGGNSKIAERIYTQLLDKFKSEQIQSGAIVIKIEIQPNGKVWVVYENKNFELMTIECEKVICAFPKLIAERVVKQLPEHQLQAIQKIAYRGYCVSNVIFDRPILSPGFDVFQLSDKTTDRPTAMKPPQNYLTDICFGSWAQYDQVKNSVWTMYRPLPFDGARQFLFSPMAHDKHLKKTQSELSQFMSDLNLEARGVLGCRLTRWGHSVPLAQTGAIASGLTDKIRSSIDNKIYFVNQDNWLNPAFECVFAEAQRVTQELAES
ncbi:MAG: FAD-dependent oxidoreductase [Pseudobdellovibrio sp.]